MAEVEKAGKILRSKMEMIKGKKEEFDKTEFGKVVFPSQRVEGT
jgi:hypothetical protein